MEHVYLNVLCLGVLYGLAARFMGNLLGKDHNGVWIADTRLKIRGIMEDALEVDATLPGCLDIVLLKPVNAAD